MIRRGVLATICLLVAANSGCLAAPSAKSAFEPKLQETGGPAALYSIRGEQVTALFPIGSTLDQISQKYGKPTLSGAATDKSGKATNWVVYTYGRSYTHVDKKLNVIAVNRFVSATLQFDGSGILGEVSLSRYQNYATATDNREATDEEVARYLGAPVPLDIKVDAPPAGPAANAAAKAVPGPQAWKLGLDISELRSEYAARTGYTGRGVYVVAVDPKGLAALAGLNPGDVIVKLNGVATPTRDDLVDQLKSIPTSTSLTLEVFSQRKLRTITVPAQQPAEGTVSI